jgi:hypothetical protein
VSIVPAGKSQMANAFASRYHNVMFTDYLVGRLNKHGFALIREGTLLEQDLVARRQNGVDWTVDIAVIYHKQRHPKTIPVLVRILKRNFQEKTTKTSISTVPSLAKVKEFFPAQVRSRCIEDCFRSL